MDILKNERKFNMSNIIETGYYVLDDLMKGFCPGELVLIAGRPGMGKTSLALNIAKNVAELQNIPTVFFSLEMSKEQIINRTKNKLWQDDIEFVIDDTPALSVEGIIDKCRMYKKGQKIGLVVIDYLELINIANKENVNGKIHSQSTLIMQEVMKRLKALARELSVPVIITSQYPKLVDRRENKRPVLDDLKIWGIEDEADVVLLLYRDECYNGGEMLTKGIVEINIAKQPRGKTCFVELAFIAEYCKFASLI
jgi:replicative DNA helicase